MIPRLFVLVVDQDTIQRRMLSLALRRHDYQASEAVRGADALAKVSSRTPDAVLLDPDLPDMDGHDLLRQFNQSGYTVLIVSSSSDERRIVEALDDGACDYITKPYRENELMARLRGALRRKGLHVGHRQVIAGDLRLDITERRLFIGNREITLNCCRSLPQRQAASSRISSCSAKFGVQVTPKTSNTCACSCANCAPRWSWTQNVPAES
jgi:two-component system, OmpR family, KDP operon response regulator KdpE